MICGALLLASAPPDEAFNNAPFGAHITIDCRINTKFRRSHRDAPLSPPGTTSSDV